MPRLRRRVPLTHAPACLERRVLLSGTGEPQVLVTVDGDDVSITGTDESNEAIYVVAEEGGFTVIGADGTKVNGSDEPVFFAIDEIDDLNIDLGAGHDFVELLGLSITSDLEVSLGEGDDRFAWAGVFVDDNTDIHGGPGFDDFYNGGGNVFELDDAAITGFENFRMANGLPEVEMPENMEDVTEAVEAEMPAVTVEVDGDDVTITGTDEYNEAIYVVGGDGGFTVIGADGTKVNGSDEPVFFALDEIDDLSIHLFGGNDFAELLWLDVTSDLEVSLGEGDDRFAWAGVFVDDDTDIHGGPGFDDFYNGGGNVFELDDAAITGFENFRAAEGDPGENTPDPAEDPDDQISEAQDLGPLVSGSWTISEDQFGDPLGLESFEQFLDDVDMFSFEATKGTSATFTTILEEIENGIKEEYVAEIEYGIEGYSESPEDYVNGETEGYETFELDTILTLFDGEGNVLAQNDDGGDELASEITFEFTESGTYFVAVSSFNNFDFDPIDGTEDPFFDPENGSAEGDYELHIEAFVPPMPAVTVEIDDDDVTITGTDAYNEAIYVIADEGGFSVIGADGTTVNGSYGPVFFALDEIDDLTIHLFGGNDFVELLWLDVTSDLDVSLGDGDDRFAWAGVFVDDETKIDGGEGDFDDFYNGGGNSFESDDAEIFGFEQFRTPMMVMPVDTSADGNGVDSAGVAIEDLEFDEFDIEDLLEDFDVGAFLANFDLNDLLSGVDLDSIVGGIDFNAIVGFFDLNEIVDDLDLEDIVEDLADAGLLPGVDLDAVEDFLDDLEDIDLNALAASVDLNALAGSIDFDSLFGSVDLNAVVAALDFEEILDDLDIDDILEDLDFEGLFNALFAVA